MNSVITTLNSVARSFVDSALVMLIQSSLLIIVLLILDLVLRRKVRAVFRYCIWMLVLVKLVLPTTLSFPTGFGYWYGDRLSAVVPVEPTHSAENSEILPITQPETNSENIVAVQPQSNFDFQSKAVLSVDNDVLPTARIPIATLTWQGFAFIGWLVVIITMALLLIQRMFFIKGLLNQSKDSSERFHKILEQCCKQMGIRGHVRLKLSPVTASPSVCGLFHPTILIPECLPEKLNPRHLKSIFLHELAHIKQKDLWVSLFQTMLQIVYFYNPLVWVANVIIRKVREQAVDELVLVTMGEQADEYPETLLNVSRLAFSRPALSLRLIGVVESKKALIRRIKHVTSRPFPKSAKLGFGGLAAIVIIAATLLPMAKANRKDSEVVKTKQDSTSDTEFEGKLIFHQDLPVGIIAGTSEHPKLVEIKSIRFESTYGNAWGVTARVGWLPAIDATWKLKVELLDEKGKVLRHSRDEAVVFTGKAGMSNQTAMQYVDLDLDAMHNQGRRHVTKFWIFLEPVEEQFDVTKTADMKTHTVEVVVVQQANKKPVPDASLVLSSLYIRDSYRREQTLYTTDSQGRCQIRLNAEKLCSLSVTAQKHGFASMTQLWSNAGSSSVGWIPLVNLPERHTFEMLPASTVGGIVQDKAGDAIEAVEVRFEAYLEDPSGRISIRRSVRTDANGQWRVESVPPEVDRISIGLKHPEYGGDHGTNRYMTGKSLLNARALKHVETLDKGITVTGQVLDSQGQPIAGATAMLAQRNSMPFFAITDPTGSFRFVCSGDRDTYGEVPTVVVEAPGYAPAQKAIDIEPDPEPLEFRLTRGRSITCRVVDTEGRSIVGAWTVVEPLPENSSYGIWLKDTDEQGEFQVPNVPKNDVNLTVGKEGYVAVRDYVLALSEEEVVVTMKRALRVRGTVTDAESGIPIPNFEVTIVRIVGDRNFTGNTLSFDKGTYELKLDEVRSDALQLKVSAMGYEPATSEEFKIDESRRVIDFPLARASDFDEKTAGRPRKQVSPPGVRRITGLVRDEKSVPVSDAVISTRPSLGAETTTNADGTFTFRTRRTSMTGSSSREETAYLLVRHKERNLAAAIELDDDAETLDVKLTPGVIMSGKVVDIEGRGIPDAKLSLTFWVSDWGYGGRYEESKIDPEGNFEIRAIPVGYRYSVNATAEGYGQRYVQAHTSEAVGNLMELEPLVLAVANLSISGIVVDENDQPVFNIRVYAYGNGQPTRETFTNSKGEFTIKNVCPGQIRIQVNSRDRAPRQLHGRIQAKGGATDVKIVVAERDSSGRPVPKQPPSLVGKPLPDIKSIISDFAPEQVKGQIVLVCFFDMQQRPSRNCIIQLSKKANELKAKNVVVIAVHASKVNQSVLDDWIKENNIPYPVGMIQSDEEKTRFIWGVRSLPWSILANKVHAVIAEGFSTNELDEKIKTVTEKK